MLQRPLWTEGTLLCPQHLQQQDLYHERLLAARLAAAVPHPWGLLSVRLDPAALATGQLTLTHLRAILPDGTPIEFSEHSPGRPPPRSIAPHFPATRERLTVHLGAPELRPGAANVGPPDTDTTPLPRWRSITRSIFDLTLAHSARDLELALPQPVLRFADEPRDELTSIPLAELIRDPAGGFTLDPTFIPPIATLSASEGLHHQLQTMLAVATTRWRALESDRRRHHDLPRALFFHTLSAALPRLRHLVDHPTSPLTAHQLLLGLAGELRGLASQDPTTLPTFNYTDLRATLGALASELLRRLSELLPDRHLTVPLEPRPDGLWLGELRDERLRGATFILAVESHADPAQLARDLPTITRIAAWSRISLIVRNNVLGAAIRPLAHPPVELPALPHHTYFAIPSDDPTWLEILRERNVALYLPPPHHPEHARVSLFAIPPRDP